MSGAKTEGFLHWQSAAVDAIRDDRRLTSSQKLVLYVLVSHADELGACFVSLTFLAIECAFDVRSVIRLVQQIERLRYVVVFRAKGPTNRSWCNTYRVTLAQAAQNRGDRRSPPGDRGSIAMDLGSPEQTTTPGSLSRSSSLSISETSLPLGAGRGVTKCSKSIPSSWVAEAHRWFSGCHAPTKFLVGLASRGFSEEEGKEYLGRAGRATDLPKEDHRALAAWCSEVRTSAWLKRRRRRPPIAREDVDVQIPMMSVADVARAAAAAMALGSSGRSVVDSGAGLARATGTSEGGHGRARKGAR